VYGRLGKSPVNPIYKLLLKIKYFNEIHYWALTCSVRMGKVKTTMSFYNSEAIFDQYEQIKTYAANKKVSWLTWTYKQQLL
jgi:hypothetical protein